MRWNEAFERGWPGITKHQRFPNYAKQLAAYLKNPDREKVVQVWPCLDDHLVDMYYFYQDRWAAHEVLRKPPSLLVDVGSTALLAGILSLVVPTVALDIRPFRAKTGNLLSACADIRTLPFADESLEMLTSMCVIEHVGLGRYGAKLDTQGSAKAFAEVARVMRWGGSIIFSVPLAKQNFVQFNAHRVFTKPQVLGYLPDFILKREAFLFPQPGGEADIERLKPSQSCVWCAHMVKARWHT